MGPSLALLYSARTCTHVHINCTCTMCVWWDVYLLNIIPPFDLIIVGGQISAQGIFSLKHMYTPPSPPSPTTAPGWRMLSLNARCSTTQVSFARLEDTRFGLECVGQRVTCVQVHSCTCIYLYRIVRNFLVGANFRILNKNYDYFIVQFFDFIF